MDYYTIRESTVNLCFMDISKAFDKVNHYGLYIKLMKRNVPPVLLHVITRSSADADNRLDAFSGQSRSTNMVPFSVHCDFSLSM